MFYLRNLHNVIAVPIHPIFIHKPHLRLTFLFNLLVALFFQTIFLLGDVIPVAYAHTADEKTISHGNNVPSPPGTHKTCSIRDELEQIAGYAEDIFEFAKAGKWKRASKKLTALEKIELNLANIVSSIETENLAALTKSTSDLERNISARNRQDAMITANKITAIAALSTKSCKPRVPTNVALLEYYCRELEIWSELKTTDKLPVIVIKMHLTWQSLMPLLIAEGGSKNVKKFSEIMKHLDAAKTPEEFGYLAISVLDEVDNLEKVFTHRP
ncbi:MAG: hypothetical protein HXX11_14160 [Desulfuromonadales bacterium]|nr:hypothetical protein [Desulfuromonadales bacterium]